MRRDLRPEDLGDLLILAKNAVLATRRHDDSTLLSPVWHEWRNGGFDVITGIDDVKVRQLRRDPRASIVVADDLPPYRGIEVRGTAKILGVDRTEQSRRIAIRYLGAERGDAYSRDQDPTTLAVIRLEPGILRAWDFADEFSEDRQIGSP
ncbi:MAG: pyridoxamine 5'-phosphate oxidase family protein [Chloroflexota bacterium]